MALDRHRTFAVQPGAAGFEHECEHADGLLRIFDGERRRGVSEPDLDAEVGAVQLAERVLVGHVVTEEHDGARRDLHAQRVDGGALVRGDHGQLDDLLAVGHVDVRPGFRAGADGVDEGVGDVGGRGAHVHGDRRRLLLQPDARRVGGHRDKRGLEPRPRRSSASGVSRSTKPTSNSLPCEPTRWTSLGSRESVARSRSARPETTATVVCGSAASVRTAATASGSGTASDRVGDDRCQGAVVVAGDQQMGDPGDAKDRAERSAGSSVTGASRLSAREGSCSPSARHHGSADVGALCASAVRPRSVRDAQRAAMCLSYRRDRTG